MAKVKKYNIAGEELGQFDLPEKYFSYQEKPMLVKEAVVAYLANQRQGTVATKDRGQVNYSTAKMWRQKGTGRARSGSRRNPVWVGGGTVFGPKPRDFSKKINKKKRRLALFSALSSRAENVSVLDVKGLESYSTKKVKDCLGKIGVFGKKCLFLHAAENDYIYGSSKNIKNLNVKRVEDLNAYIVLNAKFLVFTEEAINKMQEVFK